MVDVSVIIPTFGAPVFLGNSIQSVLFQTLTNWELFVVDDNNPDTEAREKTVKLMQSFTNDCRIHYLKHPRNLNGAVARNTGLAEATGKYIAFLDSDDEYKPERLQKCFELMEEQSSKVAAVYTGCEFRKGGNVYQVETNVKPGNYLVQTLACTFMFCTGSNIFVRKNVVDEINGFDGKFLRHQDYEFLARIFKKYEIEAIPEVLVIKNNENVNLPNVKKMIDIKHQYLEKFADYIQDLSEADQRYIYHSQWLSVAEAAQRSKDYSTAKEYYKKATEYGGLSAKEIARRLAFRVLSMK